MDVLPGRFRLAATNRQPELYGMVGCRLLRTGGPGLRAGGTSGPLQAKPWRAARKRNWLRWNMVGPGAGALFSRNQQAIEFANIADCDRAALGRGWRMVRPATRGASGIQRGLRTGAWPFAGLAQNEAWCIFPAEPTNLVGVAYSDSFCGVALLDHQPHKSVSANKPHGQELGLGAGNRGKHFNCDRSDPSPFLFRNVRHALSLLCGSLSNPSQRRSRPRQDSSGRICSSREYARQWRRWASRR